MLSLLWRCPPSCEAVPRMSALGMACYSGGAVSFIQTCPSSHLYWRDGTMLDAEVEISEVSSAISLVYYEGLRPLLLPLELLSRLCRLTICTRETKAP